MVLYVFNKLIFFFTLHLWTFIYFHFMFLDFVCDLLFKPLALPWCEWVCVGSTWGGVHFFTQTLHAPRTQWPTSSSRGSDEGQTTLHPVIRRRTPVHSGRCVWVVLRLTVRAVDNRRPAMTSILGISKSWGTGYCGGQRNPTCSD